MADESASVGSGSRQVDVEDVMAAVRARAHGQTEGCPVTGLDRQGHGRDAELYRSVHQASMLSGRFQVDYQLGWRTPVIGHAWLVIRKRIHQEIRIYIDALTRQQSAFNSSVARALARVANRLDDTFTREELAQLRAEIETLRAEVSALSERLAQVERGNA